MQYFGGKAKIAKELSIFLNSKIQPDQTFVDLLCGSCNVVSKIQAKERIANDLHKELIALHIAVQQGQELPSAISESEYKAIKLNRELYPDWLVAFVGFGLSFSGKYFGGYARGDTKQDYCANAKNTLIKKHATMSRNYCQNAKGTLLKKHSKLDDVVFTNLNYSAVQIPLDSFIYCDIPYKDTTKYSTGSFDHEAFYKYAKQKQSEGHVVYVSEYEHNVPEDWKVVWRHESTKSIRNKDKVQEATVEVVMTPS